MGSCVLALKMSTYKSSNSSTDKSSDSSGSVAYKHLALVTLVSSLLLCSVVLILTYQPLMYQVGPSPLSVGLLYTSQGLVGASSKAIQDIFTGGGNKDPGIFIHTRNRGETNKEAVRRMRGEGVTVFIGLDTKEEKTIIADESNIGDDSIFLSYSRHVDSVSSLVPSYSTLSMAYLHLINTTSPTPVTVLPVLRDTEASTALYSAIVRGVRQYPGITLLSPVVYTSTNYPRSDAFQVISSIGQIIQAGEDPQILILSPEDLPDILGMTHVNPTLKDRRWFAVEAVGFEDDIRANLRGRKMTSQISLTTLSFLGNDDSEMTHTELRNNFLNEEFQKDEIKGTVYEEYLAYEAMVKLHKAFREHQRNTDMDFSSSIDRFFGFKNNSSKKQEMFAAMFLMPEGGDEVYFIPRLKWLVEGIVTVSESSAYYEEVATSPLTKSELKSIHLDKRQDCLSPTITINILPTMFLPKTELSYTLDTFPTALILPIGEGVGLALHCADAQYTFTCRPTATKDRELACISSKSQSTNSKHKREVTRDTEGKSPAAQNATIEENKKALIETASDGFEDVIGHWKDLLPSAFTCFASVAGCDFCYYFLGTYNISLSPAACSGSCSLSVVGSCTGLMTESISNTFG